MPVAQQKYMVLTFGYSDLVGIFGAGGMERVKRDLSQYNLFSVLQSTAKMSSNLLSRDTTSLKTQAEFLRAFFPQKQRIKFFELAKAKAQGQPWVIVHAQSLLVLIKTAVEVCPRDTGKLVDEPDLEIIGYLLLTINDEMYSSESGFGLVLPKEYERERLRAALARYHFFLSSERLAYKLGRYHWLIKEFRSRKPHGLDIDALFIDATGGINLEDYISVVGSLLVKWANLSKTDNPTKEWLTCRQTYFANTQLKKESIDRVIDFIAMHVDHYFPIHEKFVAEVLKSKDSFFYNFYPLMRKPLLFESSGECFVCPSVEYLNDKLNEGIYRTIETLLLESGRKKEAQSFSIAWGDIFEQYINTSLSNAFPSHYMPDVKEGQRQVLDGLIVTPNFAFLIETKSFHWTFHALITGDRESMEYSVKNLFATVPKKKGLAQISRFIEQYRKGEITSTPNLKDKYLVPVLVVSSAVPMDAYNRRMFEQIAFQTGSLPKDRDVFPFIILTVEEIEILEAIAKDKTPEYALDILAEYSYLYYEINEDGFVGDSLSFKNFLYHRNYEGQGEATNNIRLLEQYEDMMEIVSQKVFGRQLNKPSRSTKAKVR